jgi:dihydropteroate synthase
MGADIINDVSGGAFDPDMDEVLAAHKPGYVLGHSPARPDQMQQNPRYAHVVDELLRWFNLRMNALVKNGLPEECICLDPCIGFGKTPEHTLTIIAAIPRFLALGRPLYFGISRKSFIGAITGQSAQQRDTSTQVVIALLAQAGVHVHRVHQVADTVATLKLVRALMP